MTETKPSETVLFESRRGRVVGRKIAIGLGIACIILAAVLGTVLYMAYSPANTNSVTNLQSQISQLQNNYDSYVSSHHHTDDDYNSLQDTYNSYLAMHHHSDNEYSSVQSQVNDLTITLNLGKNTIWVDQQTISQPASSFTVWTFSASFAGYVSVYVASSTVGGTHVEATYSSNGVNFHQELVVNAGNYAVFPILPSSSIEIGVGNGNILNGATETVTVTYFY